jgi:hypothetical protein
LAIQEALTRELGVVNFRELHYFVTREDIADELGKRSDELRSGDIDKCLQGLGLDLSKEVFSLTIDDLSMSTHGYFVPQSALDRIHAHTIDWAYPREARKRNPRPVRESSSTDPDSNVRSR